MLIRCQECELQVSDKALSCPHCGYPMRQNNEPRPQRKSNKRRRLPNGFGQISEIKNQNLRKPFRAMITVGKTPTGRPICKPLKPESFFETYNDAYMALVEYNKNPYDLSPSITVKELYEKWTEEYFKRLKSDSAIRTIKASWNYCSSVYDMRAVDIRARHVKGCMTDGVVIHKGIERHPSPNIQTRIKSMFNMMFDYAVEYDLVDKNCARMFNIPNEINEEKQKAYIGHLPFSDEEMQLLWDSVNDVRYVDVVLIQCYSGWRPQELGLLLLENVDLINWTFKGGMKTSAGTDRIVPIHPRIRHLVTARYKEAERMDSKYLINCTDTARNDKKLTYEKYQMRFYKIRDQLRLGSQHKPHDGRVRFVTMAKRYGVDEYAIKYMIGHAIQDMTERVYTQREVSWLHEEMKKIK